MLKDSQKRAAYDRYGHQAFAGGAGGNPFNGFEFNFGSGGFSDIFADVFSEFMGGGRRGGQRSYAQRGEDVRYNLSISLEEAFSGVEKEITIPSTVDYIFPSAFFDVNNITVYGEPDTAAEELAHLKGYKFVSK